MLYHLLNSKLEMVDMTSSKVVMELEETYFGEGTSQKAAESWWKVKTKPQRHILQICVCKLQNIKKIIWNVQYYWSVQDIANCAEKLHRNSEQRGDWGGKIIFGGRNACLGQEANDFGIKEAYFFGKRKYFWEEEKTREKFCLLLLPSLCIRFLLLGCSLIWSCHLLVRFPNLLLFM